MRFCRLGPGNAVPDANTLWDFREALIATGALERLFARLEEAITAAGYLPMAGEIGVTPRSQLRRDLGNAPLVSAPLQRNTDEEKARIKAGEKAAQIWSRDRRSAKGYKLAKARQKIPTRAGR